MIIKKQPLISCTRIDQGKSKFVQTKHKMDELESKTNARRAQGGLGLLSHTISVQKSQVSMPLILERRDGAERQRGERGAAPGRRWCSSFSVAGAKEREERERGI